MAAKSAPPAFPRLAAVTIAPPIGTRVRLLRDGRPGRVVAWSQGGLICRVRLDAEGGAGEATVECPGCELLPIREVGHGPAAGDGSDEAQAPVSAPSRPWVEELGRKGPVATPRLRRPAGSASAVAAGQGRWNGLPLRRRGQGAAPLTGLPLDPP